MTTSCNTQWDASHSSVLARTGWLIQEGSLYALLLLLPFSSAAVEISFGTLLLGWILVRLDPQTRSDTVWLEPRLFLLATAVLSYLGICALSTLVSDYPTKSAVGFVGKWLEYLWFFVMIADVSRRPHVARRSLYVLACSAVMVILESMVQERVGRGLILHYPFLMYKRITGPYQNPTDLATYLMVIIPLLFSASIIPARRLRSRLVLWLPLIPMLICLNRTDSVGAWLALGVALIVGMAVFCSPVRRASGLMLLLGIIVVAGLGLSQANRVRYLLSASDVGRIDRLFMWQAAAKMIRDRPVLGHGVNTFMANYVAYWVGGERQPRYAHNCYLQVAAETGLLGLISFLGVLWLFFQKLLAGIRRAAPEDQALLFGCGIGLLAFALQAAVDTNFYSLRQAALFWILAGFALGLCSRASPPGTLPAVAPHADLALSPEPDVVVGESGGQASPSHTLYSDGPARRNAPHAPGHCGAEGRRPGGVRDHARASGS